MVSHKKNKTLIPTAGKLIQPQACQDIQEKLIIKHKPRKSSYDKHKKSLRLYYLDQPVYIKDQPKFNGQQWELGHCIETV